MDKEIKYEIEFIESYLSKFSEDCPKESIALLDLSFNKLLAYMQEIETKASKYEKLVEKIKERKAKAIKHKNLPYQFDYSMSIGEEILCDYLLKEVEKDGQAKE
jgi:hypothetical protein